MAKIEMIVQPAFISELLRVLDSVGKAVMPLVEIANAYDDNNLDDEARKFWGKDDEHQNTTPPKEIRLYTGRGGGDLLTLQHCLDAREAVKGLIALADKVNDDSVDGRLIP